MFKIWTGDLVFCCWLCDSVGFSLGADLLSLHENLQAFDKHIVEKDIAEHIKKEFDKKHGPTWHCIVGKNFGNTLFFIISRFFLMWDCSVSAIWIEKFACFGSVSICQFD